MSDLISRCELFNRLATVPAPPEANEFKAEVYKIIQGMETESLAEQEYLSRLFCEIQHNKVRAGGCHVGPASEWCIFGSELEEAIDSLAKKRRAI